VRMPDTSPRLLLMLLLTMPTSMALYDKVEACLRRGVGARLDPVIISGTNFINDAVSLEVEKILGAHTLAETSSHSFCCSRPPSVARSALLSASFAKRRLMSLADALARGSTALGMVVLA